MGGGLMLLPHRGPPPLIHPPVEGPRQALVARADCGAVGVSSTRWEGDELTQTAQDAFDIRVRAVA